jgi:hypothetical protein
MMGCAIEGANVLDQPRPVTLPADVLQVDETGYVWTFVDRALEPAQVVPGEVIVAGDEEEPFSARVIDIVDGPAGRQIVHLEVIGVPDAATGELG